MTRALAAIALLSASAASAATVPAFPGAEGYGASATGGRGGDVYAVTTLADDGPGSLREGLRNGDRTIVFRVSGTIDLKSRLDFKGRNLTIAGQTAPGDGICLRGRELMISDASNVIVRYVRFRPGDEQKAEHDALSIRNSGDVIVDHCSMSWSTDSLNDVTHTSGNVTVQWCLLAEPLVRSVHAKGSHGYATGWDGRIKGGGSFHHNLIAHAVSRAPRIGYHREGRGQNDCRNNVIYASGPAYGGEGGDLNFVGNYYRPGPGATRPAGQVYEVWSADSKLFASGNVFEGASEPIVGYRASVDRDGKPRPVPDAATCLVNEPFAGPPIATQPAAEAYELVLAHAGATLPKRDAVDERIVRQVRERTGKPIDSQSDVGGWPELKSAEPPADGDRDGMPDAWEEANGLNPADAADGRIAKEKGGYTNLELYLNSLVPSPRTRG